VYKRQATPYGYLRAARGSLPHDGVTTPLPHPDEGREPEA